MESSSQWYTYRLHSSIHHHGETHNEGHYTYTTYNWETSIKTTIDATKVTEEPLTVVDGLMEAQDLYMATHKLQVWKKE